MTRKAFLKVKVLEYTTFKGQNGSNLSQKPHS